MIGWFGRCHPNTRLLATQYWEDGPGGLLRARSGPRRALAGGGVSHRRALAGAPRKHPALAGKHPAAAPAAAKTLPAAVLS